MPRNYIRKTNRQKLNESVIKEAVNDVIKHKKSYRVTALKFNINYVTLYKRVQVAKSFMTNIPNHHVDSGNDSNGEELNYQTSLVVGKPPFKSRQIFKDEDEVILKDYLTKSARICYGLTYDQTRCLAFEFANHSKLNYPSNWNREKKAGIDWMLSFMSRHPDLSVRKPENTSIARASSFNKFNVGTFFQNYEKVQKKCKFSPERIWNYDETGITTVLQAPKVIAEKKRRQVGQVVSAERGELVTFCGIVNAVGRSLPPVYIFPRIRYKDHFLNGATEGCLGFGSKKGWMVSELFVEVLRHIAKHTKCTPQEPILLLMDNHSSHVSIECIVLAKEKGIVLLSFPPHCSHRMQPLDVGVYGPFKSSMKLSFNNWISMNPGRPITIYDIGALSKLPYLNAFSMKNILSSFEKTGIWPINEQIFSEEDFMPSYSTDRPDPENIDTTTEAPMLDDLPSASYNHVLLDNSENTNNGNNYNLHSVQLAGPSSEAPLQGDQAMPSTSSNHGFLNNNENASNGYNNSYSVQLASPLRLRSLENIRPYPKAGARKTNRKTNNRGKSTIFTDTPEKMRIEALAQLKKEKKKKIITKKCIPRKNVAVLRNITESSSESDTNISLANSSDSAISEEDNDDSVENMRYLIESDNLKCNDFVIVKFAQKGYDIHFVAQIKLVFSQFDVEVKFLRKNRQHFVFPLIDDVSTVSRTDIVVLLPPPQILKGTTRTASQFKFEFNFEIFNELR